jgi:hemoglobin-like flavoprotein
MQLSVIVAYYRHKSRAPGLYLQVLGTRHKDRGVPAEMYEPFCEILLEVMATFFGDDWDDDLAQQWRIAVEEAANKMREGYDQRFHV